MRFITTVLVCFLLVFLNSIETKAHSDEAQPNQTHLQAGILLSTNDWLIPLQKAQPGDVFTVMPGTYTLERIPKLETDGTISAPITLKAQTPGTVKMRVRSHSGLYISGKYWIIENLDMEGVCSNHNECQHAIHITGDADNVIIRNNRFKDFNAAIKSNGKILNGRREFPDRIRIERNYIYNDHPRQTGYPVTPIDVVGGSQWILRENFIADFHKAQGDKISYAAFLKGNSDQGLFERNLIICEWKHKGGIRLGLSFGGGGTEKKFCKNQNCDIEHYGGIIRSNVILNCPADVGVYLNKAANTKIVNNTILGTTGVDVRFQTSFAKFDNNIIEGRIKDRDKAKHRSGSNIIQPSLSSLFPKASSLDLTPSSPNELRKTFVTDKRAKDFCTGKPIGEFIGAFAYPMNCNVRNKLMDAVHYEDD